jgi:hypothetical protein
MSMMSTIMESLLEAENNLWLDLNSNKD